MPNFQVYKETALPTQLTPHSIYLVAPPARPDFVEMYVTGAEPSTVKRVVDHTAIQAMIDAAIAAGSGGTVIVDDIAARNALDANNAQTVLVIDASADPTVDAGSAYYVWRESTETWIKIAEAEGLDNLDPLTGRLEAAETTIEGLVTNIAALYSANGTLDTRLNEVETLAQHANRTQLDEIGENAQQQLTYRGQLPKIAWDSVGW